MKSKFRVDGYMNDEFKSVLLLKNDNNDHFTTLLYVIWTSSLELQCKTLSIELASHRFNLKVFKFSLAVKISIDNLL